MIPLLLILYCSSKYFVIFYLIINYAISMFIYFYSTRSYFPRMKFEKDTREKVNMKASQFFHEEYPAYNRTDLNTISLFWIYFGFLNYVWIKALFCVSSLFLIWLVLKVRFGSIQDQQFNLKQRKSISRIMRVLVWMMYTSIGVSVNERNYEENYEKVRDVYSKYMGNTYDPAEMKDKFTTIIANHSSWLDILYLMSKTAPSFISKDSIRSMPLVGTITVMMRSLLIDRKSKDSKEETKRKIAERQKALVEGKEYFPLCLFPEGTTTNGRVLISFKKGAFYNMTPVKPYVMLTGQSLGNFSISSSTLNILIHIFIVGTFFRRKVDVLELPVIVPNEYMVKNFSHLGKDEAEVFTEVSRRIISEVSGIPLDVSTFDDKLEYLSKIKGKTVKNT